MCPPKADLEEKDQRPTILTQLSGAPGVFKEQMNIFLSTRYQPFCMLD